MIEQNRNRFSRHQVGHHPHIVRGMTVYDELDQRLFSDPIGALTTENTGTPITQ
jgi:hypothetical protein